MTIYVTRGTEVINFCLKFKIKLISTLTEIASYKISYSKHNNRPTYISHSKINHSIFGQIVSTSGYANKPILSDAVIIPTVPFI